MNFLVKIAGLNSVFLRRSFARKSSVFHTKGKLLKSYSTVGFIFLPPFDTLDASGTFTSIFTNSATFPRGESRVPLYSVVDPVPTPIVLAS